jgi:hypothetical protein
VTLAVVPMFHITGMVSVMHTTILAGATLVIMPRWDRELAGRLISRWKVTHWTNIPTMVIDLLGSPSFEKYDLSSLVYIGGGGAAMPQAVAQRLLDQYRPAVCGRLWPDRNRRPLAHNPPDAPKQQCLGIPFMSTDARSSIPKRCRSCRRARPAKSSSAARRCSRATGNGRTPPQAFIEHDGKRFFRSGDLGRVDEDGYFFMTDRLKRMINASGFKVWPAEVEALMFRHPAIQEACIISTRRLPWRVGQGRGRVAPEPPGAGVRAGPHRLVPRQHGGLQGAARGAVRRGPAQERQRQGDVAHAAGAGGELKRDFPTLLSGKFSHLIRTAPTVEERDQVPGIESSWRPFWPG